MKRKVLFPFFGRKDLPAGMKMFLLLLVVFLWGEHAFSQNWNQIIKTVAADRTSGVHLGSSVAISGDYAIVGAPQDGSGSAYIFQKSGADWIQMQKIVASDADSDDNFGISVAISGDYAVVGAVYDNGNATNTSPLGDAGSAYIFKRTGATWAQEQKIVASDRQANDYFGSSVAISGDYVVVGALLQNLNASGGVSLADAGGAYIFKRTGTTWAQEQKIVASDRAVADNFGYAVAISGDYVVISATGEDEDATGSNTLSNAGSAYVFFRTGTTWAQQQKIVASDRGTLDAFGWSASISGDYLIIGALNEDEDATGGNTATDAGSAYIFTRTGTTWAQQQKIVASDRAANDNFASSVSISGDFAIVGTLYEDENASGTATLSNSGSAYVFSRTGTTWAQNNKIVASDRAADDNFGKSVAISGNYAIVGALYEDEDGNGANTIADAGSVYIFKNCGTITGTTTATNVTCNSGTNGTINLTPSGGTPGYTFNWGSGITTEDRTGLAAGTYTVTIKDLDGCTGVVSGITVTQPLTAVSKSTTVTNITCNGGTNGTIDLTPSGGTPGYTYNWGSGITSQDRTGLGAASYSVIITDANGCAVNFSGITVTQPTAVSGTTTVTNVACFGNSTGAINLTPSGGTPGYTFSWGGGITTEDRTGLAAATYAVIITDANGCTKNVTGITVTQPTAAVSGTTVVTNVSCFSGTNGTINLTPSGGTVPYSFLWDDGLNTEDRTGLAAGTLQFIITDANNCTSPVTGVTITQPTAISVTASSQTNVTCNGGSNGAASINAPTGGTPGYTYNWTPGTPTGDGTVSVTGLTAGTWTCIVTDANGCVASQSFTVTQPTAVSGTTVVTNVTCFGGTNGTIALSPPGYTYNWGGGITVRDRINLSAGTYTVIITDANGCTGSVSATITQPTSPVGGTTVVTNVACNGGTNGAINLTILGANPPYTFNWNGGNTTEDRIALAAGTYSVIITDGDGCTGSVSATVTQPTALSVTASSQTNVSCFGGSNGAAAINTPTGGTPGYTYNWTPGTPTGDGTTSITGLTAGTWTCAVTDANGCVASQNFTVTQPPALSVTASSQTNVSCNGGSNGAAAINTPTGGAGGYTYNWTPGNPTGDGTTSVTGLTAGTWTCTVTDANGCVASPSFTVTQPPALSVTASSQTNVSCNGGSNGAVAVNNANGGAGGYTYNWTPGTPTGDGTTSITGLTAGTWTCTVTDANSCVASQSFTVTQPTAISLTASSQTNVSCNGGSNGAVAVNNANGGAGGYTYNWTPGTPTGDGTTSITGLTAGTWTCTVTDANSCVASQSFTVTQPNAISFNAADQTNVSCFGGSNGTFTVNTALGGAGSFTYDWAPGTPTGDGTTAVTGLTAGTYSVTATDANSCTATITFTITQPTALSVTPATQTNLVCNGGSTGAAAINTPTGGTPGYSYDWALGTPIGDGTTSINGLTAGTWTCNVTDAKGCVASQSFTVTEPNAISFTAAAQTNVACFGNATGSFTVNAALGGTGSFIYDWTPGTPTGDGTTSVTGLTAGTYSVTATDANSCMATITFTITEPTAISVTAASQTNLFCYGDSNGAAAINTPTGGASGYTYDWSPGTPTGDGSPSITGLNAGTWTCDVTDANGCMASQSFTLTEPAAITNSVTATSCYSYTLNGTTYNTSGTYTQVLMSQSGCDSTLTLNLTIIDLATETLTETSCSSYTLNGTMYTASGSYMQVLPSAAGCDSLITLNLYITQPTSATLTETACTSYTLNGTTYNTSGTYTQMLTNAAGCDSTITLIVTINMSTVSTLTDTGCDSYTLNGSTYTSSGVYTQVIENAAGCDSTITLNLTINNSNTSALVETACESYTLNGQTYTVSGVYTQLLTNTAGCDSILTLTLTIHSADADTTTATTCDSYLWNGQTFTTSGFYTLSFTNANGCDSIENLDLIILPSPVAGITSLSVTSLQASGIGTYQWINCSNGQPIAGATNATFTATSNGSYAVIVTNGSCSDTSGCVVISQVGLEENNSSFGVALTPNPTQNDVKITFTGTNEASIVIYDAQGKAVMTADHIQSGEMLSTQAFERGVYMVHIMTTSGNHTERLVKQ
jgi:hypothetical protein